MPKARDPHEFQRVGEILGKPTAVDPTRPNTLGGATRTNEPPDFPLYRVEKVCRVCGSAFLGPSPQPQYDGDEPQNGWCGCPIVKSASDGRWTKERSRPHLAGSAPARRARDPLLDD